MTYAGFIIFPAGLAIAAYIFGWAAERLPRILSALRGEHQPLIMENAL